MSKLSVVLLVAAAVVSIQAQYNKLHSAAQSGKWSEFNVLVSQNPGFDGWQVPQPQDIKTLKPGPGTRVYGQTLSSFKSSKTVNGRRTDYSAGHKVVNDNGKVEESDFKP